MDRYSMLPVHTGTVADVLINFMQAGRHHQGHPIGLPVIMND